MRNYISVQIVFHNCLIEDAYSREEMQKELNEILLYLLVIAIVIIQENLSSATATFIVGLFQSMHIYYPIRLSIKFAPATFRRTFCRWCLPFQSESVMCQIRCSTRLDAGIWNIDQCIAGELSCSQRLRLPQLYSVWSTQCMFFLNSIRKHHVIQQNKLYFQKASMVNTDLLIHEGKLK